MEQLELLWYLQKSDLAILKLEKALEEEPLIAAVKSLEAKLEKEKNILAKINNDINDKQKNIKRLDMDLKKANDEIKTLRRKLYGGEVSNLKELGNMEKKLDIVEKEKDALENITIEQIEILEEEEKKSETQKNIVAEYQKKLEKRRAELKEKLTGIEKKISEHKLERKGISEKINDNYLEKYKVLIKRPDKKGVARVENDICEGCRVYISSAQRGKLYNPETMLYCENCGRLLVWFREDIEAEKNKKKE